MNGTIIVDGREVILSFNPETGQTIATFPNVHLDPLNPSEPLMIIISPQATLPGILANVQALLDFIFPPK